MLTRPQVQACLLALGFAAVQEAATPLLTYAGIQVRLLDASRLAALAPSGELVYLAVASAGQLEAQLTDLLGYQRPMFD